MKKKLVIAVLFFAAFILIFVSINKRVVQLPDYEKWPKFSHKAPATLYSTINGGCSNLKDDVEISPIPLSFDQYRDQEDNGFIDMIKNTEGEPWLLIYNSIGRIHLFKRRGASFIFSRWRYSETLSFEGEDHELIVENVIAFMYRNCIFFPIE